MSELAALSMAAGIFTMFNDEYPMWLMIAFFVLSIGFMKLSLDEYND